MKTDALIIGAGPVGLTMAIELARYGVTVRLVDKASRRSDQSKALVLWSRSLELLERSGVSKPLVDAGYKVATVNVMTDKQSITHFTFDGLPTAYPYGLMIPQNETERILEEFVNGLGVKVEREVELMSLSDTGDKVVATLRRGDASEETVETGWLIGCDGAHSTVRHLLGMEFHGETLPIDWLLADIHLEGVARAPEINVVWHPDGLLATFPIEENRYRIIANVGRAEDAPVHAGDPTLADVQEILDQRFPGGVRAADPVWLSRFRINERKVADYRSGRVFLAGDAAHVHSPAGGQGMNTGMQDAFNLAWKLAMVVRGETAENLLGTYSPERSPIAEAVLKATGRMTSMVTMENKLGQSLRNRTAAFILGLAPVRKFVANVASEISLGYPDSPLNAKKNHLEPAPGERAPIRASEPAVGAGDAPRFAIFAQADGIPAGLLERFADLVEPALREPYNPDGLWVVRPDGYAALAARRGDWDSVTSYLEGLAAKGSAV
jgi:2-polyprenyl-6-methoxyphenol hydroxylase-like FAD-dependent oxidoreductase